MKGGLLLTPLQALVVNAGPHHRKQRCLAHSSAIETVADQIVKLETLAPAETLNGVDNDIVVEIVTLTEIIEEVDEEIVEDLASTPIVSDQEINLISTPKAGDQDIASDDLKSTPKATDPEKDSEENVSTADSLLAITPKVADQEVESADLTPNPTAGDQKIESQDLNLVKPSIPSTLTATDQRIIYEAPTSTATFVPRTVTIETSSVLHEIPILTAAASSGIAQILPPLSIQTPETQGLVITSLNISGHESYQPLLNSSISTPTSLISVASTTSSVTKSPMKMETSDDIFQPINTASPPSVLGRRPDHPVQRLGIQDQGSPISTNKFYASFFLGNQSAPTWTHPYSLTWSRGGGRMSSWGMAIDHIDSNQRIFGPNSSANPVEFFTCPLRIQSLVLSAMELGSTTAITLDSLTAFSANVNLLASQGSTPAIIFPLVQGMGFVTAIYNGATPTLETGVLFRSVTVSLVNPKAGITKYTILLENGKTWLLYAYSATNSTLGFTVVNSGLAQATSNFEGIIQIAKSTDARSEALYDAACGVYPTTISLSGSAQGKLRSYTMSFAKQGMTNKSLVMFALPHHVASFSRRTRSAVTGVQLDTTTNGVATAVLADVWTLYESLPYNMGFAPDQVPLTRAAIETISNIAVYGKALAKFAGIIYTINDLLQNKTLAQADCFALFANNNQQFPLVYETAWGGIVSTASYVTGDSGADFGNTYYNDHHFHYGYFIYTAAVIGYLDPDWLALNKDYVNALVRDIANPSTDDNYFTVSRSFDWYHGHSWAHGLYESYDGKDQESSSEDSMAAYAIKMWGRTIGDSNMEARGNLQLAVLARSLQNYFLYETTNTAEPANFIGNKVSGILFENKIDHTTYFGSNIEYIQGIHMIPLLPSSTLTRTSEFVSEEWNANFSNGRVDSIVGGWKGILYANLALIDPTSAWIFFNQPLFDASWLDGGASLIWYLAWAASLGAST